MKINEMMAISIEQIARYGEPTIIGPDLGLGVRWGSHFQKSTRGGGQLLGQRQYP